MIGQIGNTPLRRLTSLSDEPLDIPVFIKDESANLFHTHKDRRSQAILDHAVENDVDRLVLITAGNAGYSLAMLARETHVQVTAILDQSVSSTIKNILSRAGATVVETDLSTHYLHSDEVTDMARQTTHEKILNVTNGYEDAYVSIMDELIDDPPSTIVTPVGSGELFTGLYRGIRKYNLPTKLVGVGVQSSKTKANKLFATWTPTRDFIESLSGSGHELMLLSDEEVEWAIKNTPSDVQAEPSAAVVFRALYNIRDRISDATLINTGNGLQ